MLLVKYWLDLHPKTQHPLHLCMHSERLYSWAVSTSGFGTRSIESIFYILFKYSWTLAATLSIVRRAVDIKQHTLYSGWTVIRIRSEIIYGTEPDFRIKYNPHSNMIIEYKIILKSSTRTFKSDEKHHHYHHHTQLLISLSL